jgi:hypothetical protein
MQATLANWRNSRFSRRAFHHGLPASFEVSAQRKLLA